mmetsp:Transcript_38202/g.43818  ORF Transcript_38202/g.43818 Transcript_38202/m.43818 type:complete len:207 (-) Transcript_38202:15-635(-)
MDTSLNRIRGVYAFFILSPLVEQALCCSSQESHFGSARFGVTPAYFSDRMRSWPEADSGDRVLAAFDPRGRPAAGFLGDKQNSAVGKAGNSDASVLLRSSPDTCDSSLGLLGVDELPRALHFLPDLDQLVLLASGDQHVFKVGMEPTDLRHRPFVGVGYCLRVVLPSNFSLVFDHDLAGSVSHREPRAEVIKLGVNEAAFKACFEI